MRPCCARALVGLSRLVLTLFTKLSVRHSFRQLPSFVVLTKEVDSSKGLFARAGFTCHLSLCLVAFLSL